jgi:hypothetical protein
MFGLGKQKSKKEQSQQPEIDSKLAKQIHIMPERFYVKPKKKSSGLFIIIALAVLIVGILAIGGFYLNESLKKKQAPPPVNTNQPVNQNVNQNLNINTNTATTTDINTNTNIATSTNINTNINLNTNVNVNSDIDTNTNTNVNTSMPEPLPFAADEDDDGLTLAEESLYGTNPELSDSDGDGYSDSAEILNGYDPTQPTTTLADSGLFEVYANPFYSIIYPHDWELRVQDEESEILFISVTGEFVEVLIIYNVDNLSLAEWYQEQFPEIDLDQVTEVKINDLSGFRHPDNLSYYFISPGEEGEIFLLIYNVGNFSATNFATTFNVMVKSFKLLP